MENSGVTQVHFLNSSTVSFSSQRFTTPLEVAVILISIAAILVNSGVLLVIFIGPRSFRTPTFFLISSLATADMLTGISVIFAISLPVGESPLSRIFLKGLAVVSFSASVNNLLAVAADRFLKIKDDEKYQKVFTRLNTKLIIGCAWTMSVLVFLILPASIWNCNDHRCQCTDNGLCVCDPKTCSQCFTPFTKSYIITGVIYYYLCFIGMVGIYISLFLYVRESRNKLAIRKESNATASKIASSNLKTATAKQLELKSAKKVFSTIHKRREIRLAKTLFMVMGIFFVCWIPVTSLFVYDFGHKNPELIHAFDYCLISAVIHPFVNPIIYSLRLPRMWRSFKMLAYACWRKACVKPSHGVRNTTIVRQTSKLVARTSFKSTAPQKDVK